MKLTIYKDFGSQNLKLCFFRERVFNEKKVYEIAKPIQLEWIEVDAFNVWEPTITVGRLESKEFIDSLVDTLKEYGIAIESKEVEGELRATKYHLQDMRTLVLERKKK